MNLEQETPRLIMRVLTKEYAPQVLEFYRNNASVFEQYEPIVGEDFYTLRHHEQLLQHEYNQIIKLQMLRFWLFEKDNPEKIIGTICFQNITPNIFASASVGYKMDAFYRRRGYCYEALVSGLKLVYQEIGIRRFEALVLPENIPSISLLEKIGFSREGLLKDKVFLQNRWRDHYLYSLIIK